jgi:hypothetical protein
VQSTSYYSELEYTTIKLEGSTIQITVPATSLENFQGYRVGTHVQWLSPEKTPKYGIVWATREVGSSHYTIVLAEDSNTLNIYPTLELYERQ